MPWPMDRRSFVAGFGVSVLGARSVRAKAGERVVVIGAGLAGLSAARALVAAGVAVTVLEAGPARTGTARALTDDPLSLPIGPDSFERLSSQAFMTGVPVELAPA